VFDEQGTIMHVGRGLSGLQPLRWRCPPEITQLTLVPFHGSTENHVEIAPNIDSPSNGPSA
jgi:hypothetical protein